MKLTHLLLAPFALAHKIRFPGGYATCSVCFDSFGASQLDANTHVCRDCSSQLGIAFSKDAQAIAPVEKVKA